MTTLAEALELAAKESFLAVVSTLRQDNTIQSTLVNAGSLPDPLTGADVIGFVTYGKTKLSNLRSRPQTSITFRSGWQWATIEGTAHLIGPDDPEPGFDAEGIRLLLRQVFSAAGGIHDNWDDYDKTMTDQRRTAVLVTIDRIYSNRTAYS